VPAVKLWRCYGAKSATGIIPGGELCALLALSYTPFYARSVGVFAHISIYEEMPMQQ